MNQATVPFASACVPEQPARSRKLGIGTSLPRMDSSEARAEVVTLLLFLHARPCRAYTPAYLHRKLGFPCVSALDTLLREGLVACLAGEPPAFSYGVEDPQLLAAVDELSRCYHAVSALLQLVTALVRARASARRGAHPARLNKPKQGAPALASEPGPTRRAPRLRKRFPQLG
jgi:hypothetical protein